MTLSISGTLSTLIDKVLNLRNAIEAQRALGFDMFHPDSRWLWKSTTGTPCLRCAAMVGSIISGDMIPSTLRYYRVLSSTEIHPEYHQTLGWGTPCYCRLILQNGVEVAGGQLRDEMERAII